MSDNVHQDMILALDRFQGSPAGLKCQADPEHGKMGVHGSGKVLLCTAPACKFAFPVSQDLMNEAIKISSQPRLLSSKGAPLVLIKGERVGTAE